MIKMIIEARVKTRVRIVIRVEGIVKMEVRIEIWIRVRKILKEIIFRKERIR